MHLLLWSLPFLYLFLYYFLYSELLFLCSAMPSISHILFPSLASMFAQSWWLYIFIFFRFGSFGVSYFAQRSFFFSFFTFDASLIQPLVETSSLSFIILSLQKLNLILKVFYQNLIENLSCFSSENLFWWS